VAVGVNHTLIAQLAPDATLVPHVLVWTKSPVFKPVIVMLKMLTVTLPSLASVIVLGKLAVPTGWLLKVTPLAGAI